MTNASEDHAMTEDELKDRMASFEKTICDGNTPWELIPILATEDDADDEDGPLAGDILGFNMWILDAEMDPYLINFDCDGVTEIRTEGYTHITLYPEDLKRIAKKAKQARRLWEDQDHPQ